MDGRQGSRAKVRLYVAAALRPGAAVPLHPDQSHYAGKVMRLGPGDDVLLFNGRDGEWRAQIESLGRKGGEAIARARTRAQGPEPDAMLWFAPLKKTALDFVVEKATELGIAVLQPVLTRRTVVERVNLARLRARAIEAAEQCGRLTVPEVRPALALERALGDWAGARPDRGASFSARVTPIGVHSHDDSPARRLYVADETGGGVPAADAFSGADPAAPAAFLVGPEGGFERSELDALARLPFVTRIALGPRLLRAETAALAVLACWQALAGDGRALPPPRE
ncbi:MAG: 16S rRNA (uracil(1498)-N(3))-methyltransferase [Rhodospirillales bacterium]|nr:16S rRNA (uracil(1498)-N(3))-methyltransferase [Rhodospirillales bacterium]MSP80593.1 16S rRNA (uracil(1498)-N(3))-methyltransferase [Rhodospirillales bacterium]